MKKLLITMLAAAFLSAGSLLAGTVSLAWDSNPSSDQVIRYSVYYLPPGATTFTKLADVLAPTTSYTTPSLSAGTYSFRITASNATGESVPSNTVVTPSTPPAAPTNLRITVP